MEQQRAGDPPAANRGRFITFEGPDGAGKTTQIALLEAALRARGHAVARTREPGGDPVGERVRDLLLQRDVAPVAPEAELLLFGAARAQNVRSVVRAALAAGQVVLCDRFTDSTLAYQGHGRGLPLDLIRRVNAFAAGGLVPDRTFLLDLPPAEGLARQAEAQQNRLDRESLVFHERVRRGFLEAAAAEPGRIVRLDATQTADALAEQILADVLVLVAGSGGAKNE